MEMPFTNPYFLLTNYEIYAIMPIKNRTGNLFGLREGEE